MTYAQIKSGQKLHVVFEAEDRYSQPLCGRRAKSYRMTSNVPFAHACQNCQRILAINGGKKEKARFFNSLAATAQEDKEMNDE